MALHKLHTRKLAYIDAAAGESERYLTHAAVRDYFYRQLRDPEEIHRSVAVVLTRNVPENRTTNNYAALGLLRNWPTTQSDLETSGMHLLFFTRRWAVHNAG